MPLIMGSDLSSGRRWELVVEDDDDEEAIAGGGDLAAMIEAEGPCFNSPVNLDTPLDGAIPADKTPLPLILAGPPLPPDDL